MVCHIHTVYTSLIIVQDMVFLSGHCPGATESQGICQAGFIICDTAAGNRPYDGVRDTDGFLPHGRALMMLSQNVGTEQSY